MAHVLSGLKLAVIGCGAMGQALVRGLLGSGFNATDITCTRRDPARLASLAGLGVRVTPDNGAASADADVVLLCIKPQGWREAVLTLRPRPGQIVLSVMAGVRTQALEEALPGTRVARCMPNTPALVGAGMHAYSLGASADPTVVPIVEGILGASGTVAAVVEGIMDAVTVTSGSGPAYLFYLAELMIEGSVALGVDPNLARRLVRETLKGAAELLAQPGADPVALRQAVTSPGGVTAKVMSGLEASGVRETFVRAMDAGKRRAAELAQT